MGSAELTIDGQRVFSSKCGEFRPQGSVSLTPGYHQMVLVFADDGWRDELVLSYKGPDTSGAFTVVPTSKFADAEWALGREGLDCNKVCHEVSKQCNPWALGKVRTAADIRRVANLASYTCTSTQGWAYRKIPVFAQTPGAASMVPAS